MTGGVGCYKPLRSPLLTPSRGRIKEQTHVTINFDCHRRLEMSASFPKQSSTDEEIKKLEGMIVKAIAEKMVDMKENMGSFQNGNTNQVELFSRIFSICLDEQLQNKSPKCCRSCIKKGKCNHWTLVVMQEKELSNLKVLLASTKREFENLQSQLQSNLKQLATTELQEGYDVTKSYDQAGNDSFMKTPPSPPFAFRSQDTPQTPASGLKYQQDPRSPTSGFKSQQPPRSPTSCFKSQQPPRSRTSALKSCNAPGSPTSAAIQSQ
ncbi:kinesin-like protein KIN-14L, partial [Capsicum annuum]|uniref:kinesin-like protein KIN-14L n=1 Tax=Capsicum annuum TaxID=4072 RepID=UPI001FB0AEC3